MTIENTPTGSSPVERVVSLRPCPFCGCDRMDTLNADGMFRDTNGDVIARCGNPRCMAEITGDAREQVRAAWNRRALFELDRFADLANKWERLLPTVADVGKQYAIASCEAALRAEIAKAKANARI